MERFYLTTPIYYVTDAPHVGTAYCTVNADALARWHRMAGFDTFFLTGTDEHGQKVADSAVEHGVTPREWANTNAQRFIQAWERLDISYDDFIRTTEDRHAETVQKFLTAIYDNGHIYKDVYRGPYCVACEDYYTVDALVNGTCPVHLTAVVEMEEENWFFRLSAFQDQLIEYYKTHPKFTLPETKRNEALSFIKGGLRDISITRSSIDWGVRVPWDEKQVFYVWYDALINYLTAIDFGRDEARFTQWWPVSNHLIGKEIIRFHSVWWPAMCLAAGLEPPHHVQVHGWLLLGGRKLGKTMAKEATSITEISPLTLADEYGVDALRYYLLRNTPLGTDGEFSTEAIADRYNSDLANNLGNLVARVTTIVATKLQGTAPSSPPVSQLDDAARTAHESAGAAWAEFAPHRALEESWRLIGAANAFLENHEPWKMEPGDALAAVLGQALEAIRVVSILIAPAMPSTSTEIRRRIGLAPLAAHHSWENALTDRYQGGATLEKGAPLFPRISVTS